MPVVNGKEPRNERHSQTCGQESRQRFYELIVETEEGITVRVPFNGYELDDLEKQIDRCFNED